MNKHGSFIHFLSVLIATYPLFIGLLLILWLQMKSLHLIFHLDALPGERKVPLPVSIAPWSKDEGLSERKNCICSVLYWIIYSLLSMTLFPVLWPLQIWSACSGGDTADSSPRPWLMNPYGSSVKTEIPWMHSSIGLFNHCQALIGKFESTGVFSCFVLRAHYQPGFNCNRIYDHCP